ncbi:MAG: type III-A CRISPR-associated protein Cas10/Csm1, partial [Candidatus Omnitrophica bacterium]|nr:type III-A CRISPR-associated protein Cas10/Csm1 [Candidatus Omnitrophota bacterium]
NREQKIIQLADWLSSGERTIRDSDEKPTKISQEPLISIFSQVKLNNKATSSYYCRPTPITPNIEDIFPVEQKDMAINQKTNFKTLWDEFEHEFGMIKIENSDFPKIFTRIFSLLEKYTLFVPSSSYTDQPNISLFHHMKSTAAIATCIYDSNLKEQEIEQIIEKFQFGHDIDRKDFVLISGDISGIQDFIYSVTTEHALKGLRGRSFYIQMLSETIARYIIDSLELTECNLLFCGGGNFSILASNSTKALEKIEEIEKEATKKIFSIHSNLALILGWTELDYKDFLADNFPNAIDRLRLDLNIKKRRKFVNALDYPTIFEPFPKNVDKELSGCEICGAEIENQGKCEFCQSFEDLAYEIKKTDTLSITRNTSRSQKIWEKLFSSLGYSYSFKKTDTKDAINYAINDTNFLSKNCDGWRFEPFYSPGGTLEEIVEKAQGDKKWAALRMDVDNLGMIFSEGLKEKMSISRFSMLSYMMNHFFTAGIDWIRREKFNNCHVVYAGGDDLFILGPWSDIPYYAIEILDKFKSYTCNNPAITISAGVFIAP